jgi:hypothetical protein
MVEEKYIEEDEQPDGETDKGKCLLLSFSFPFPSLIPTSFLFPSIPVTFLLSASLPLVISLRFELEWFEGSKRV